MDETVLVSISLLQASRRNVVASQALLIYDTTLCANREYKYIWKAKWNLGKVLYILVRYVPLLINSVVSFSPYILGTDPSPELCKAMSGLEAYVGVAEFGLFQSIIAIRTNALYQGERWAKWLFLIILVVPLGGFAALNVLWIPKLEFPRSPLGGVMPGCVASLPECPECKAYIDWWWAPILGPTFIVFLLTLFMAIQSSKMQVQTRLITVMYRDGFLYFAIILSVHLVQFIIWRVAPLSALGLLYGYGRNLDAMLCCRLFLNLKGALTKPSGYRTSANQNTASDSLPLSTIAFVPTGSEYTSGTYGVSRHRTAASSGV